MLRSLLGVICVVGAMLLSFLVWAVCVDTWARWKYKHVNVIASEA